MAAAVAPTSMPLAVMPWLPSGTHSRSSSVVPVLPFSTNPSNNTIVPVHTGHGHVQALGQPQVQHTFSPPPVQVQVQHVFSPPLQQVAQVPQGQHTFSPPPPPMSRAHSRNSSSGALSHTMQSFASHSNHNTPPFSNHTSPPSSFNPNHPTPPFPSTNNTIPFPNHASPPSSFNHPSPPFPNNTNPIPPKNERELTRGDLLQILTHFSTLLPTYFPPTVLPLRLVAHGGACMLLHEGLWELSQSLPADLMRRTTTRDVDIIERGFKKEMEGRGVMDGVARLRKCRDETARVFGLGRDWMNADADVALPFAVDSQGHQSDSIYNAALTQDNMHLHTIFTSPNGLLTLVSVTPFWAVALKLVRYTKWDPGDVCLLLRNGTILSQVQWTPEMLETWLFRHCWEMGYKHYPPERKREMRLRIENALELMKGVWPDPHDKKEYPAFYTDKSYSPEGAMGGSKAVSGGPRKGWMWSLAGVQGDATGTGAVVAASAPAGVSSPPQDGSRHPSFTDFGHVSEWKKDGEEEKRKSRGRSKSRSRGQRPSPQPPAFGNPNREREREEDRKEKQPIFVPPAEEFSGHQQQWHSMNPNHAPVTARPRGGSYSPPDDDVHSHMAGMNIGSNIYRTERKSRNPNPWQGQTQKDVDAFNRDVEGLIYQASYVHTVDPGDEILSPDAAMRAYAQKQSKLLKERKEKQKRKDRKLIQARDEKWTLKRLSRDSSITVYTDSSLDSSSEEETDTESDSDIEVEVGGSRGRSLPGSGSSSQWQIYSPPTQEQIERSMSSMGQQQQHQQQFLTPPGPISREHSGGRKSKSPSPRPKHRPPPLALPPMPVYAPQAQQQQQQRPVSRSHTHPQMQMQAQTQPQQRPMSRSRTHPQLQQQPGHWSESQIQFAHAHPPQQPFAHPQQQQQQFVHPMYHQQQIQQRQPHQQPQAPGMGSIYVTPHVSQNAQSNHNSGIYQQTQQPPRNNLLGLQ